MEINVECPVFLGAHPDDNLIGCGGLLSRLKKQNKEFHCFTFSWGNNEARRNEWEKAMDYLKPTSKNLYNFKGDSLPDHRYEIREILEAIKGNINPDIIFTHSRNSLHQSHATLGEETERIMRNTTILAHDGIKSGPNLIKNIFFEITYDELKEKNKLISYIESEKKKYFLDPYLIKSIARVQGALIGVDYAESFEAVRIKA